MAILLGIDLAALDEMRESLRLEGKRYLNRTYTERRGI